VRGTKIGIIVLLAIAVAAASHAQTDPLPEPDIALSEVFSAAVPFNFGPPGGRALGMGGSFIAVADDATAAEANPAGLVNLTRPEASLHGRASSYEPQVVTLDGEFSIALVNANRALAESFGLTRRPRVRNDLGQELDVIELESGTELGGSFADSTALGLDGSSETLSFASYVHPFSRWTFSIYYQRDADFQSQTGTYQVYDDFFADLFQGSQSLDFDMESFGLSAGLRLGQRFSIGASARRTEASIDQLVRFESLFYTDIESFLFDLDTFEYVGRSDLLDFPSASLDRLLKLGITDLIRSDFTLADDDDDITYNVGFLWNPGGRWSFGGVYKKGGEFSFDGVETRTRDFATPAGTGVPILFPDGTVAVVPLSCELLDCTPVVTPRRVDFSVPDVIGLGLSWKPTSSFRVAVDAVQIQYSVLEPSVPAAIPLSPDPFVPATVIEPIDDEIEIHAGLEHIWFLGGRTDRLFVVRGGVYSDPDHDGFRAIDSDDNHFTAGLGFQVRNLQVDLAGDFGRFVDRALLSLVYRFGGSS
jgi:long-subunit fatty acid transport protein